ncbi:MAG: IPT/TIG domain-containing protein [Dehalococcoidia bacterium]
MPRASCPARQPNARTLQLALSLALVGLLLGVVRPAHVQAASITVTTLEDENGTGPDCSLREAIEAAGTDAPFGGCPAGSGADTITFAVTGTIVLTFENNALDVTAGTLTIEGPGSGLLFIDGAGQDVKLMRVYAPAQLTLTGLTFKNGYSLNIGDLIAGAIRNHGATLTIADSAFVGNVGFSAGAIYNEGGAVAISGSTFTGNHGDGYAAFSSDGGGAIHSDGGSLTITNSTFIDNEFEGFSVFNGDGGAIYNDGGPLSIADSTFINNHAEDNGGAIYHYGGRFTLSGSTFHENESTDGAGGAIYLDEAQLDLSTSTFDHNTAVEEAGAIYIDDGTLNLTTSTLSSNFSNDDGGAIYNDGDNLNLATSTLNNNVANGYGGAIYNDEASLAIVNSTIAANQANDEDGGGAIYHDGGTLTISSSTIAANQSGDLAALLIDSGSASLKNVLLANMPPAASPNCGGAITDLGGNIAADASCRFSQHFSLNNTDPELGPLQDNGGPTLTMEPIPGSPAVFGAVDCPPPDADQRGVPRNRPCHYRGAVENSGSPNEPLMTSLDPARGPVSGGTEVTITGVRFNTTPGMTQVLFGGDDATDVRCPSTTRCVVTTPPGTLDNDGEVMVAMVNPAGNSNILTFTYLPVDEPPPTSGQPMQVSGTVTQNGQPLVAGAIEARVGDTRCGAGFVLNGAFRLSVASSATVPNCGTDGAAVTFRVNGVIATGEVSFESGGEATVALSVTGAPGIPSIPLPPLPLPSILVPPSPAPEVPSVPSGPFPPLLPGIR